ncbi:MAG: T9SS type A sorting domain-containing protein [Crocinitomicaceae bacterium]
MKFVFALFIYFTFYGAVFSQNYTSYHTGNTTDIDTTGQGGVCLMGGASEDDNAMVWFLERANQGDVLVLRASGSDGYNNYMYTSLGVTVNSVETIVFNDATAANESYIHQAIQEAEAIWFAGGDQWDYISYWRNTAIDSLINEVLHTKNTVIGGTSAGMAIQGRYYFSAENGTVTSATALSNPYDNTVTVDSAAFLKNNYLSDVITDTHYENPDRKGRHVTFLAQIITDDGIVGKGIACDEYTAVCIDDSGMAKVYGQYPTYDDNAYFIQPNCELSATEMLPENCTTGNSLNWNRNQDALRVYRIQGTTGAANSFDLKDWTTASGGEWQSWWVDAGVLYEDNASPINCSLSLIEDEWSMISIFPNPASDFIEIAGMRYGDRVIGISDLQGKRVSDMDDFSPGENRIDIQTLESGIYILSLQSAIGSIKQVKFTKW